MPIVTRLRKQVTSHKRSCTFRSRAARGEKDKRGMEGKGARFHVRILPLRGVHPRSTANWERTMCTAQVSNQGGMEDRDPFWSDLRELPVRIIQCLCLSVLITEGSSPLKYTWLGWDQEESLDYLVVQIMQFKINTVLLQVMWTFCKSQSAKLKFMLKSNIPW